MGLAWNSLGAGVIIVYNGLAGILIFLALKVIFKRVLEINYY